MFKFLKDLNNRRDIDNGHIVDEDSGKYIEFEMNEDTVMIGDLEYNLDEANLANTERNIKELAEVLEACNSGNISVETEKGIDDRYIKNDVIEDINCCYTQVDSLYERIVDAWIGNLVEFAIEDF